MARDQRTRRLRLGHRRRRGDAPLSRAARRVAAGAARPPGDAESSARAGPAAEPARSCGSATRTRWPDRTSRTAPEHLAEFRLELGLPVWRYELPGASIEKRVLMPYGQNTVHRDLPAARAAPGPVRLALRPSIQFRGYEASVDTSLAESYTLTVLRRHATKCRGGTDIPPLRLRVARRSRGADARREGRWRRSLRDGAQPRLSRRSGRCGVPGISAPTCAPAATSRWWRRPSRGRRSTRCRRRDAALAERTIAAGG